MKTFDYETAWRELAYPAWLTLPANLRALAERASVASDGLGQLADCSMPWPEERDPGLKAAFAEIPAEELALASRVVYNLGHWNFAESGFRPSWLTNGGSWKFSHYADQSLRARWPGDLVKLRQGNGAGLEVHQGAIRLTWASRDSWCWKEIEPATEGGLARAQAARLMVSQAAAAQRARADKDAIAYQRIQETPTSDDPRWAPWLVEGKYMVEEDVIRQRKLNDPTLKAARLAKQRAEVDRRRDETIRKAEAEHARKAWLADHGVDLENVIYYDHTDTVTFGWREPVSAEITSFLLDLLCEFPYAYEIKSASRGTIGTRA